MSAGQGYIKVARMETQKTRKPRKRHPLRQWFGDSYLDFLQTIYDTVFNVIQSNVETNFTVRNYIWPWPPLKKNQYYESSEEEDEDEERPSGVRSPLPEADPRTFVYHKIEKITAYGGVPPNELAAYYPQKDVDSDRGSFDEFNLVKTEVADNNVTITITLHNSIDSASDYVESWAKLATVGLPRLQKRIKRALTDVFSSLVNDQYSVAFSSVMLSPKRSEEDGTTNLEVKIELSIAEESEVRPGGLKYEEAKSRFDGLK